MKKKSEENIIITTEVQEGQISAWLVGRTPLVLNRLSEKAKHELILPGRKKTRADKEAGLKHEPYKEFNASAHKLKDDAAPTLLALPAAAPKRALASAAIDMPGGAKKAQIGRLCWVPGEYLPVYGTPRIYSCIVRMADMTHTPDVRTRVVVPQWAIPITVNFVRPIVNPTTVINLLSAAGLYIGVGDGRPEKGALTFGQFRLISQAEAKSDPEVTMLLKQGRKVQMAAMKSPEPYDDGTGELLEWFNLELKVRGKGEIAEREEKAA